MTRIVVFGAGGRAGRWVVREAVGRGHEVTAVARDPSRYPHLVQDPHLTTVVGDVTDPASVAAVAAGHAVAVNAAASLAVPAVEFFGRAAAALVAGLAEAGVPRLVAIGIGSTLSVPDGGPLYLTPDYPEAARAFTLGHVAQLDVLRSSSELDWVVLAPPATMLDADAPRTGRYRVGGTTVHPSAPDAPLFAYADVAAAVVDEVEVARHHRTVVAVVPR